MHSEIDVNDAPLPGYRLIERLGAGGYGEVWRAEAPGGLTKAIKFVFGQQHEMRASRETRALELIKQLRHPFLLSLERIEVVDGRLLIVTELAEGSVKDRFDACRQAHLPGIPRDELLRYLRDAADALDYMSEAHGLQHLDIKPENLLLLAGHVKVADFGLVKDVQQSEASLVGGMTPLYAAPEVFRGQPSRQSDQYALAIVYQEMLTGRLPLVGSNAAELTLQHLNDEPDLSSLSGADRYVVSRALSKDPTHRYATCREFVEALLHVETAGSTFGGDTGAVGEPLPPAWGGQTAPHTSSPTELFDDETLAGEEASLLIDLAPNDRGVTELPPIDVDTNEFRPAPTLFLGFGGAAGRVLVHLRQAIGEQFGGAPLPAVQMLLVDTDHKALAGVSGARSTDGASSGRGLGPEETIHLPLRRPQHYRDRWDQLLSWLSRRWLYNIPRSMRTEGLRPLGRLAFVDHARQTCQRIRRAMVQAIEDDAREVSAAAIGRQLRRDAVRVYLIASVSGGTGSGMVLDAAYAVRTLLEKLDLPSATVTGILMHSTGRDPQHGELARVNAFSWLTEFQHFHQPGGAFPGDGSCGLPGHEPGRTAFDHTYFVHLGDALDEGDFDRATQSVANYLRLDALSPAQLAFDACRQSPGEGASQPGVHLRSLGTFRRMAAPTGFCEETAAVLCGRLLGAWRLVNGRPQASETSEAPSPAATEQNRQENAEREMADAAALVRRLQLTPAGVAAKARILVEAQLAGDAEAFLSKWMADRLLAGHASERRQMEAVDDVFGSPDTSRDGQHPPTILGLPVADVVQPLAEMLRSEVRNWVFGQLDDPEHRLAGATRAVNWLGNHVQSIGQDIHRLRRSLADRLSELRPGTPSADHAETAVDGGSAIEDGAERVNRYFQLRLDELAFNAVDHVRRMIQSELKSIADELTTFGRELAQMATVAANCSGSELPGPQSPAVEGGVTSMVTSRLDELVADVDAQLQSEYINDQGGLYQTVMQGGRPRAQLIAKMQEIARWTVQKALTRYDAVGPDLSGSEGEGGLRTAVAAATPAWLRYGGARRVLAVLPPDAVQQIDPGQLSQALGTGVSIVPGGSDGLTICVEAEQLSLADIAVHIVQRRRDSVEFAKRVHTRCDVKWTPLLAPPAVETLPPRQKTTTVPIMADHYVQQTEVL